MSVATIPSRPTKVARNRGATIVVVMVLGIITVAVNLQSARANSAVFDEAIYLFLGRQQLQQPDPDALAALGVAPLPLRVTWTSRVLAPVSEDTYSPGVFRARIERARLVAIVLFALPLVIAIVWSVAATHGLLAAVTAAGIVALSPNVIAHASLATTDVAFAASFMLSIVALIAYLRLRSWTRAVMLAVALGTAMAAKYSGLGLVAATGVVFLVDWRHRRLGRDFAVLAGAAMVWWAWHGWATAPLFVPDGAAASLIRRGFAWTGYGDAIAARAANLPAPIMLRGVAALSYLDRSGQKAFLLGQVSQFGWWYFFPIALALKATLSELAACVAFAALAWRRRSFDLERLVVVTAVIIFFAMAMMSHRALGIRYVLAPFILAVVAGTVWALDAVRQWRIRVGVAVALLAGQALAFVAISPQHLAYFNRLAGGPMDGYSKLVDSNLDWGQELPLLAAWSRENPGRQLGLAYFGLAPLAAYGVQTSPWKSMVDVDANGRGGTFVISATYLQGVFLCGDPFAGLRELQPDARIGYTFFAYNIERADVRRIFAAAANDPCAP